MTMDLHKKKSRWAWIYTKKKSRKKKKNSKSQKKWSLKKKYIFVKNKKTNSSIVLPILLGSRK